MAFLQLSPTFYHQIYVSFSGGKDSTVLLDIVRKIYPNVPAVFIDTGLEYPEVREFARSIENVTVLRPQMNFRKVIETYGYPIISKEVAEKVDRVQLHGEINSRTGKQSTAYRQMYGLVGDSRFNHQRWSFLVDAPFKVSQKCCDVMKKKPAKDYEKKSGRHPIIGTMATESFMRQNQWLNHGCNIFDGVRVMSKPISFWTEQDVLEYIVTHDLPYASVYGKIVKDEHGKYHTTGCARTGCVFCGFGCHREKEPNRFQLLKQTHPQLWDYCMRPWENGGLGMRSVLEFIGVKVD